MTNSAKRKGDAAELEVQGMQVNETEQERAERVAAAWQALAEKDPRIARLLEVGARFVVEAPSLFGRKGVASK